MLLPMRALFGQRRETETYFHPLDPPVTELPRVRHVAQVFVAGDRPGSSEPSSMLAAAAPDARV